jgi:chemotaxis family two-component system response regulator Rcp1
MSDPQRRPIEILLVEDNPADERLTREALGETRIHNRVHVAVDGIEALRFLRREGPYVHAPRPDLMLLDLNLPKKDGHEVLADIKADPELRTIPVIVLTSSTADEDIERTYYQQANAYVVKPIGLEEFLSVVKSIENFWLDVVRLPGPDAA